MAAEKCFYVGTGKKLNRKTAKKYKTLAGASAAALKIGGTVWDSAGVIVAQSEEKQENAPAEEIVEAAEEPGQEAEEMAADAVETAAESDETEEAVELPDPEERALDEAEREPEEKKKRVATVIVGGSLRLRRSPSWDNGNVCGYAAAGQKYHVKRIFEAEGRPMLETIDGLFISADPAHVRIE